MGSASSYEPILEADERFTLRSAPEIAAVLRTLCKRCTMISIYFNQGRDFILTTLLAADPASGVLVFDLGADPQMNDALMKATRLLVVTRDDRVKVQFSTRQPARAMHEGRPAFKVRFPESLLRLQRRDFYRLDVPLGKAVKAFLQLRRSEPDRLLEARLLDISCGGVAILDTTDGEPLEVGRIYPACSINLPGIGTIAAPLEICNIAPVSLRSGRRDRRIGCRFLRLPGAMQTMIQRFINQTDRERTSPRR